MVDQWALQAQTLTTPWMWSTCRCRLRRIQDLTQADVATALSKLRGVSAECVSLLQRVLQVDPVRRLTLLQIMEVRLARWGKGDLAWLT